MRVCACVCLCVCVCVCVCVSHRCCQGTNTKGSAAGPSLTLAGPMWTGALHSQSDIQDMISEAQRLGYEDR